MKKIRKVLIAVLSVMLLVCMGLFAACDNGNSNSNDNGGTSGNEQTETTYTVTYALGDHAAAGATVPPAATANKANGYKVTLPAAPAAATGWKFNGWKVGNDVKAAGAEITVSANVTVTAQWAEDVAPAATYTVTYALGDHAAADAQVPPAATATEANGYKVTLPAAVEAAEGWKFNGWKVGNDVKAAGSEITVSASMTVTADWSEVTYTVTYALGEHAAADATVPPAATANLANSYKVTLPDAPKAADGWKFNGWRVEGDVHEAGEEITVSADLTVTATWSADTTVAEIPEAYRGAWISAGADVAPETIDITAQGATYHDQSVTLTAAADGSSYTFSATVDDVVTNFTVKLLADFENRVLLLSSSSGSVYMVKEDATYPALNFSADLVGNWAPALATNGDPIEFQADALLVKGLTATVLVYDSNDTTTIIKYIVQGEIYTLTYTAETKTLTSLQYGVADAVEVSYTKEVVEEKDDSVQLPAEYQGEWANDDHTVVVDEEGNFTYDGESFKVYYDMGEYSFTDKSGKEWAFSLYNGDLYFHHGYREDFTLKKTGEDADAWNWGVALDPKYAGVYTNANLETTLIVYKDGKVTVNGHKTRVVQSTMKGFYSLELDNNEVWQITSLNSSTWTEDNKVISVMNYDGKTIEVTYASAAPDTYTEGGSTGPVVPADVFSADRQGVYKDPNAAEGGFANTVMVSANKVEVTGADGGVIASFEGDAIVAGGTEGVFTLMSGSTVMYTMTFNSDGTLTFQMGRYGADYRLNKQKVDLFSEAQQGVYRDPNAAETGYNDVITVSANKVEINQESGGTLTFESAKITKQADGTYLLEKDGTKFVLTFGDGTLVVSNQKTWQDYNLKKQVRDPDAEIFSEAQQGVYKDPNAAEGGYANTVTVTAKKVEVTNAAGEALNSFEGDAIVAGDTEGVFKLVSVQNTIKFTMTFNADGTLTFQIGTYGSDYRLQKQSEPAPQEGIFSEEQQGVYKDPMAAEGGFANTVTISANKVEVTDANGGVIASFEGDAIVAGGSEGVFKLMDGATVKYTMTFNSDGSLTFQYGTYGSDFRLNKQ